MSDGARSGDGERDAPLWASSLDSRPRISEQELGDIPKAPARLAEGGAQRYDPDPGPAATAPQRPLSQSSRRRLALYSAAAMTCLILLGLRSDGGQEGYYPALPSSWVDNIELRCDTTRFENDGQVIELFRCRTQNGAILPADDVVVGSGRVSWLSDVTKERADAGRIKTSPPDILEGWALYSRP